MSVYLIDYTANPVETIVFSARVCYSNRSFEDLILDCKKESIQDKMMKQLIDSGHESPMEHASFTFYIDNVSRVMTHQLVRHRIASFSQRSQRYTSQKDGEFIIPETIKSNEVLRDKYNTFIESSLDLYNEFINDGIPKEDARMILPQSSETSLVMTMNLRELRHFLSLRMCYRAQWEIQKVALDVYKIIYSKWPLLMYKCGTPCMIGRCTEIHKTDRCPMIIPDIV